MLIEGLTRPENGAELRERRRIAAKIAQAGGCSMCLNRDPKVLAWGRSVCKANEKRSYPLCLKDRQQPQFQLDEKQLKGAR